MQQWACSLQSAQGRSGDTAGGSETLSDRIPSGPWRGTSWYWWTMAATCHMRATFGAELGITDRWRDSAAVEWQAIRGRALAALGREQR